MEIIALLHRFATGGMPVSPRAFFLGSRLGRLPCAAVLARTETSGSDGNSPYLDDVLSSYCLTKISVGCFRHSYIERSQ